MVRIKEKHKDLKKELIACLKPLVNAPLEAEQKKELINAIAALDNAKKPIVDDKKLSDFLLFLILAKMPDIMRHAESEPLKRFCQKLRYEPAPEPASRPSIRK